MRKAPSGESEFRGTKPIRLLLNVLDAAMLLALLLLPLVWFFDPLVIRIGPLHSTISWDLDPVLAVLVLLAARLGVRARLRRKEPSAKGFADSAFFRNICLAVLPTFFLLVGLEAAAKWAGVRRMADVPIVITGEEALDTTVDQQNRVVRDPELLFAFNPGITWDGYRINRHGFRTWEFPAQKPQGTLRVISLGDSCTAQGHPPYSDRLNELLKADPPTDSPWEAFNMGVYGYSILQGYRQFVKYGHAYSPDVVTIYFGWNDHWTHEKTDRERMAVRLSPRVAKVVEALRKKRLYAVLARWVRPTVSAISAEDEKTYRVPLEEYEDVLEALVADIRNQGAVPVVLTAPRRALHPVLVKTGHARSPEEAERVHDEYVEATRNIAREKKVELLDLAELFAAPEYDGIFLYDGIHFKEEGLELIAQHLSRKLNEMVKAGQIPAVRKLDET
ncbi:MAG: GDSL-type esterase/lipase family protein [Verrucomicrobiota bacterium]|nr:GDSL-type esterase/lipase family protein [Verrucomicrobiota bacterium]